MKLRSGARYVPSPSPKPSRNQPDVKPPRVHRVCRFKKVTKLQELAVNQGHTLSLSNRTDRRPTYLRIYLDNE